MPLLLELFDRVKEKFQAVANHPKVYVDTLPSSPAEFLKAYPTMAKKIFSEENLPVSCPLDENVISLHIGMLHERMRKKSDLKHGGDATLTEAVTQRDTTQRALCAMMANGAQHKFGKPSLRSDVPVPGRWINPNFLQGGVAQEKDTFEGVGPSAGMKALLSMGCRNERKMEVASAGNNGAPLALEDVDATSPATPARFPLPLPSPSPDHKLNEIERSPALDVQARVRKGLQLLKGKRIKTTCKRPAGKNVRRRPASKPASWMKKMPNGCNRCRFSQGCTMSCWIRRGGPPK